MPKQHKRKRGIVEGTQESRAVRQMKLDHCQEGKHGSGEEAA